MSFYYDSVLNDRPGHFQQLIPNATTETENRVICVNQTAGKSFGCLVTNVIPNLVMCGGFGAATQCFPYYVYNGDGSKRRDNITDWALQQFRTQYLDELISKWDIFHYVYAVLHHPQYREKYAANLKRELPRMPFAPDFHEFVEAGARLAELHIGYEIQPEYPLQRVESKDEKLNWRVERMRLSKDRTQIVYNNFLTLGASHWRSMNIAWATAQRLSGSLTSTGSSIKSAAESSTTLTERTTQSTLCISSAR